MFFVTQFLCTFIDKQRTFTMASTTWKVNLIVQKALILLKYRRKSCEQQNIILKLKATRNDLLWSSADSAGGNNKIHSRYNHSNDLWFVIIDVWYHLMNTKWKYNMRRKKNLQCIFKNNNVQFFNMMNVFVLHEDNLPSHWSAR